MTQSTAQSTPTFEIPDLTGERTEDTLAVALAYVRAGFKVFPVHTIGPNGTCSCGRSACGSPGKHPKTTNGFKDASNDEALVRSWFGSRFANLGVATGAGIIVVDVDVNRDGDDNLQKLEAQYGALPETLTVNTGGGGQHFYFRTTGYAQSGTNKLCQGVDIKADGGYVVAPPSLHVSGNPYLFDLGQTTEIAEAPAWLKRRLAKPDAGENFDEEDPTKQIWTEPGRNSRLTSLAGKLRQHLVTYSQLYGALKKVNEERCSPPLPDIEVMAVARSVSKYRRPPPTEADWQRLLKRGNNNQISNLAGNCSLLLMNLPEWRGRLCYDEFRDEIRFAAQPPTKLVKVKIGERLEDRHYSDIQLWLSRHTGTNFSIESVHQGVNVAAHQNKINELKTWLEDLVWDGTPRLDSWLVRYCGALDNKITRNIGAWFLMSCAARGLEPGVQADHVLCMEGKQGVGKSSLIRILAGDWYCPTMPDLRRADAAMGLQGTWICEIGELDAFRGVAVSRIKDFITQRLDTYRRPYARTHAKRPRTTVFIASTNTEEYLEDETGGRRFWPVKVHQIDLESIRADREQLFAEAVDRVKNGERWHPTNEEVGELSELQEQRQIQDPWFTTIQEICEMQSFVTTPGIARRLGFDTREIERKHSTRIAQCLVKLGFEPCRQRVNGQRVRGYKKKVDND